MTVTHWHQQDMVWTKTMRAKLDVVALVIAAYAVALALIVLGWVIGWAIFG